MFKSLVCGALILLSGAAFASTTTVIPSQTYVDSVNKGMRDYVDNDKNFVKSDFQPNSDNYYINIMKINDIRRGRKPTIYSSITNRKLLIC